MTAIIRFVSRGALGFRHPDSRFRGNDGVRLGQSSSAGRGLDARCALVLTSPMKEKRICRARFTPDFGRQAQFANGTAKSQSSLQRAPATPRPPLSLSTARARPVSIARFPPPLSGSRAAGGAPCTCRRSGRRNARSRSLASRDHVRRGGAFRGRRPRLGGKTLGRKRPSVCESAQSSFRYVSASSVGYASYSDRAAGSRAAVRA